MIPSRIKTLAFSLLVLAAAACSHASAADAPLTVAVLDFESRDDAVRDLGAKVSALLGAALSATDSILLVERAELSKALGEQELGLSGTVSPETAARVGHLTGAKVIVTGRVFNVDKDRMIVAKIIGTETSRVFGELAKAGIATPLGDQVNELATRVKATLAKKSADLVARVEPRSARVERLRQKLSGARLPSLAIAIPETHFGAAVRDPAAQTELMLILRECGFRIVDPASGEKAEVTIVGEAFSALGMSRGNLIACKARVELKAQGAIPAKTVIADRETSMAVDISEQTAAKTALENAAAALAERLAPLLARR